MPEIVQYAKEVKTRKPHYCFGCQRDFPAGVLLTRTTYKDDGRLYTLYTCAVCEAVFADWESADRRDGYCEGDLKYGDKEAWEAKRTEIESVSEGEHGNP